MSENMPIKPPNFFCSEGSLEIDEPVLGSAPETKDWLLLEYPEPFGNKALNESSIPEAVKAHLNEYLDGVPFSRLLLIKNKDSKTSTARTLYSIDTTGHTPKTYRHTFEKYEDLLTLDLANLPAEESGEKFLLVCTNGKRDKCCAKYGLAVYQEIERGGGIPVWETSHLGQHRLGPNALAFPHGIYYGRLTPDRAAGFVENILNDQISLDFLRGRASYTKPEQAAEGLLREKLNNTDIDSLHLINSLELDNGGWEALFDLAGQAHTVRIQVEKRGTPVFASCVGEKTVTPTYYDLVE